MQYTKKYPQVSKAATYSKFRRMTKQLGYANTNYLEVGFSNWWYGKSNPDDQFCDEYAIYTISNYHSESTLDRMYKTNFKNW
jgi:hypothetical protein